MEEVKISGYRVYGINDDHHVCSCCGKRNLKKVVWMAALDETGSEFTDPEPYGVDCAAKLLKVGKMSKEAAEKKISSIYYQEFALWKLEEEKRVSREQGFVTVLVGYRFNQERCSLPPDLAEKAKSGEMSAYEARKETIRRFPIFGVIGGSVAQMMEWKKNYLQNQGNF